MLRIALVDDCEQQLIREKRQLEKILFAELYDYEVFLYLDPLNFLSALKNIKFDMIFLDIDMPDINGIDLSKKIYKLCDRSFIVFITSHDEYMIDSFGPNVYSFINKDDLDNRLAKVVISLTNSLNNGKCLPFKIEGGIVKIALCNIMAIIYEDRKVFLLLSNNSRQRVYNTTLLEIKEKIDDEFFVSINRSTIINLRYVKSTKYSKAYISDSISFEISDSRKKEVDLKYLDYLMSL